MAAPTSTEELIDFIRKSGVVPSDKLERFVSEQIDLRSAPSKSVNLFVQKKLLTSFQAKLLIAGRFRGFRIGQYLMQDQLGKGGMGAVYLGVHETLRRQAAIKVLPKDGNKLAVERFLREARAAAALDHPNIVRMHDVGCEGTLHYLVMEYVEGQTLEKLVNAGGPLSTQLALEYVAQVASGLQHAYEKGFIHRDIKPSNLILGTDGTVKILDMGLARSFAADDQLTALLDQGAVVGTADYISPEQAMNDPKVDIRTDIYSLGATFFSILTGRPPFDGPTASKLLQHQMKDAPSLTKLDRTIPKALAQVVAKMMAKKPGDRFQTPADVITALGPWLIDTPSLLAGMSKTLAGSTGQLRKRDSGKLRSSAKSRPKWLWPAVGVVAAVAVLGIGLAIGFGGGSDKNKALGSTPGVTQNTPPNNAPLTNRTPKPGTPSDKTFAAPPAPPNPNAKVIFAFDAGSVDTFSAVVSQKTTVEGRVAALPFQRDGLGPDSYKEGSRGKFSRLDFNGRPGLMMANMNADRELNSSEFFFQLEKELGCALNPGGTYSVEVDYATIGEGSGRLVVQTLDFKNIHTQPLPATSGDWRSAELRFRRDPKIPVRLLVYSDGSGLENGLVFEGLRVRDHNADEVGVAEPPRVAEPPKSGEPLYKLSWDGTKAFSTNVKLSEAPDRSGQQVHATVSSKGDGKLPDDWVVATWQPGTVAQLVIDRSQGEWALGLRNLEGPPTAMLFAPRFASRTGYCRVHCEILFGGKKSGVKIRLAPNGLKAEDAVTIEPQEGWQTINAVIDCRSKGPAKLEFHITDDPDQILWIRKYEVFEAEAQDFVKK